jgi:hypothetical protein
LRPNLPGHLRHRCRRGPASLHPIATSFCPSQTPPVSDTLTTHTLDKAALCTCMCSIRRPCRRSVTIHRSFAYSSPMGGERASTARMRLAGEICCNCKITLPPLGPNERPRERYCSRCAPQPARRVYMSFMNAKGGWLCQFLEPDLKTPLPRTFTFQTPEKVEELIRRGGGMHDLASRQAVEHGLDMGRGGVYLNLTEEQYRTLKWRQ